jgi:hypothetical protein
MRTNISVKPPRSDRWLEAAFSEAGVECLDYQEARHGQHDRTPDEDDNNSESRHIHDEPA